MILVDGDMTGYRKTSHTLAGCKFCPLNDFTCRMSLFAHLAIDVTKGILFLIVFTSGIAVQIPFKESHMCQHEVSLVIQVSKTILFCGYKVTK